MGNDREIAMQAEGELIALINEQLLRAVALGACIRKAQATGMKDHLTQNAFDGNDIAVQMHLKLLDRVEELGDTGITLEETLERLRKEGWITKLSDFYLQHAEKQHGS